MDRSSPQQHIKQHGSGHHQQEVNPNNRGIDRRKRNQPLETCQNKCVTCSEAIVSTMEKGFYHLGYHISKHPVLTILGCLIFTGIFSSGIAQFYQEEDALKLWPPKGSLILTDHEWVTKKFPGFRRFQQVILTAENVLEPAVLKEMLDFDASIKAINKSKEVNWENLCLSWGVTETGGKRCASISILELWQFNKTIINSLTLTEIQDTVSNATVSPYSKIPFEVSKYLGGIRRDGTGRITGAKASFMQWILTNNDTTYYNGETVGISKEFEESILDLCEIQVKKEISPFDNFYYTTEKSRDDEGNNAVFGDLNFLFGGYAIVIVFVCVALGYFNLLEQRIYISLGGLCTIFMSMGVGIGLALYAGVSYGPLHNMLPFLVLGLGVDDMFVIIQSLDSLPESLDDAPVYVRMAHAMQHAGVSITVTSLTDVLAFGIGATSSMPALSSFCIYTCVAIAATYFLQCTFFVAIVTVDEQRKESRRDACLCCFKHGTDYEPNDCSQTSLVDRFFSDYYARFITCIPSKVHIILVTAVLLAVNVYGVIFLKQDFNPDWLLPSDSYAGMYISARNTYFPDDGNQINVYVGNVDFHKNFTQLEQLCTDIATHPYTETGSTQCWFPVFRTWLVSADPNITAGLLDKNNFPTNETSFSSLVGTFLQSNIGARFGSMIQWLTDSSISATRIPMKHKSGLSLADGIEAMNSLRATTTKHFVHEQAFPYGYYYQIVETNKAIKTELYRNVGLAFLCVAIMIYILLTNVWLCLLVLSCVVFTLVDVGGMLYYWGLTVDTVTSILIILAVGLAIDYSAHVAFTFMTKLGDRDTRTGKTLARIGPAVFYGGFSTFLAFVLLAGSTTYVFKTFFKVFMGVTVFGLFHGLAFLPVMLSLIGPQPYSSAFDHVASEHNNPSPRQPSRDNNGFIHDDPGRHRTDKTDAEKFYMSRVGMPSVSGRLPGNTPDHHRHRRDDTSKHQRPGSRDRDARNGPRNSSNNAHLKHSNLGSHGMIYPQRF